jgi:hypothetical protein
VLLRAATANDKKIVHNKTESRFVIDHRIWYIWILKIKCVNFPGFSFTGFVSNFSVSAQNQQYTHDLKDFNKTFIV